MEEFYKRYVRICREQHSYPLEAVSNHIQSYLEGGEVSSLSSEGMTKLELSGYNLTPDDCNALATALTDDLYFEELNLCDCLLSEEASKILLRGLMENQSIKRLNLKGNNIRSGAAEMLGQFLKKNSSVRSLLVEWNSLGLWDNGMRAVSEGLAVNQSLLFLDLRNNQVSHEGASQLAVALKKNHSLRGLDLRWNNIGLLGGRELLEALKYNKGLIGLELTGNNIPQDIIQALSIAIQQNSDRQVTFEEHRIKTEALTRELEMVHESKRLEVSSLKEEINQQRSNQEQLSRSTQIQIHQLKVALDDRKSAFDALSTKLSTTESELLTSRKTFSEQKVVVNNLTTELQEERQRMVNIEQQHRKKVNEILERNQELEQTVSALQRKNKGLENKICSLEEDMVRMEQQFVEKGKASDLKFQAELLDTENKLQKELNQLQKKALEYRETTKGKVKKLEEERNSFEEEVSNLRTQLVSLRLTSEEELRNTKTRLKQEEIARSRQYDEHISQVQASQNELQLLNTKQLAQIAELQSQLNTINRDNEVFKRQVDSLKQQLELRDADFKSEVSRSRLELDAERKTQADLRDKIADLEDKISEMTRKHKEAMIMKDNQLEQLNEKMRAKENDIRTMQEEEMRRAELLEKAIYSYVSSTKSGSRPGSPYRS
ncbi:leucine-rich repeat-containing protein 45-like [Montipora capricornis]|uniref:leucine-rich repeat-containing protein 45-like n=1 Tax=Montipora capricornis TaxID=246305 RepID=UPI0035F120F9